MPTDPVVSPADTPAWYDKERVEALTAMIDDPDLADIEQRARRVLTGTQSGRYTKRMLARDVLALLAVGERDRAEHYDELLAAERRALAAQEFIAWTLDEFGARMPEKWKAHARAVLAGEEDAANG